MRIAGDAPCPPIQEEGAAAPCRLTILPTKSRLTIKLTCRYGASGNSSQVQRLVGEHTLIMLSFNHSGTEKEIK